MRLYRFRDVVGNSTTIRMLKSALVKNSLPNFIIMTGPTGTGKSTCAEIVGLYLTCLSPEDGEPCLKCRSCVTNIKALQSTGVSTNLVKKNLAHQNSKKEISELIKEVFVLKGSVGANVYILEELQELHESEQRSVLEEIDRLDKNTFVIGNTTNYNRLIPDLRGRAISFRFTTLNRTDLSLLFDRTCMKLNMKNVTSPVKKTVLGYSKGLPRNLVNMIDYVAGTQPTEEDLLDFLCYIKPSSFVALFESFSMGLKTTVEVLDFLLSKYPLQTIIDQLKEFILELLFYIEGDIVGNFEKEDVQPIRSMLPPGKIERVCALCEKLNPFTSTETDLKFTILRVRQLMSGKEIRNILSENKQNASIESIAADRTKIELEQLNREEDKGVVPLTKANFMNYFDGTK